MILLIPKRERDSRQLTNCIGDVRKREQSFFNGINFSVPCVNYNMVRPITTPPQGSCSQIFPKGQTLSLGCHIYNGTGSHLEPQSLLHRFSGMTKYRKGPQGTAKDCTGLQKSKKYHKGLLIRRKSHFSAAFCCPTVTTWT